MSGVDDGFGEVWYRTQYTNWEDMGSNPIAYIALPERVSFRYVFVKCTISSSGNLGVLVPLKAAVTSR